MQMNSSRRPILVACIGISLLLSGFWLLFHVNDIGVITLRDGNKFAPYGQEFTDLAHLLMYAGTGLGVLAALVWMCQGTRQSPQ